MYSNQYIMLRPTHVIIAALLTISAAKPCVRVPSSQLLPIITQGTSASYSNPYSITPVTTLTSSSSSGNGATTIDSGSFSISTESILSYSAQTTSLSISYTSLAPSSEASTIGLSTTEPISSSTRYTEPLTNVSSLNSEASTTTDVAITFSASASSSANAPTNAASTAEYSTTGSSNAQTSTTGSLPSVTPTEASITEISTTTTPSTEPGPSSTGDRCFKALALQDEIAVTDCSARLVVTVTPPVSTVTQTVTVTAVERALDTALFTETITTTGVTETLLFTTSTTVTASTQTDTISEQTTFFNTLTDIYSAPTTITTTTFNYLGDLTARGLRARQTASPVLPDYAATACSFWEVYVSACQRISVEASTVTLPMATETVIESAATSATSIWSTVSSTQTDIVSVTTTVSSTQINIQSLTVTSTTTKTDAVTSTVTMLVTITPTSVVELSCQARGINFRIRGPNPDGTTRWMNVVNNAVVAWQTFSSNPTASSLASSTWVLSAGGYFGLANPINGASETLVAYFDVVSSTALSVQIKMKPKSTVDTNVAAGTYARVPGCVDRQSNSVVLTADGRSNILSCGNSLYLSRGDGSDVRRDCILMVSTAVLV
ncbi:hypothetical protein BKA67DRAFT_542202 [Truncatella angustata]|uniref:Uncharacterized protein n=1 Tax=Truncatella angustata TaxID=152316 RepID=A0A9P8UBC7_9PEZI|nr:uncharacterized protein BKA67DRAFT_542202 [Truncatella angustata]KAH6645231.1 hypothetical protein BKA67DRAFT_542202 [Truncatella angustata]